MKEERIYQFIKEGWIQVYTFKDKIVAGEKAEEVAEANKLNLSKIEIDSNSVKLLEGINYQTHYTAKGSNDRKLGKRQLSVMRSPQKFWTQAGFENSFLGAPSWQLFKSQHLSAEEWGNRYIKEISKIGFFKMIDDYGKDTILYCCEKDPQDCHRSRLAEYLSIHIDKSVNEVQEVVSQPALF